MFNFYDTADCEGFSFESVFEHSLHIVSQSNSKNETAAQISSPHHLYTYKSDNQSKNATKPTKYKKYSQVKYMRIYGNPVH